MKLAVLSGKGGAGKTLTAVSLAAVAGRAVYVDCDVEEPNGRLFLKPEGVRSEAVAVPQPTFDAARCTGCRTCVKFCRFNALVFLKGTPMVFPEVCHACGGCALVCPQGAVTEVPRSVGAVEVGAHGEILTVTGVLNPGESSGVPVIKAALHWGETLADGQDFPLILDCPPGSACPVVESVGSADFCLLVAEPTAFGLHNLKMVHELVTLMHKPCGIVINRGRAPYAPLEAFCEEKRIPVLARIPYRDDIARIAAAGGIVAEELPEVADLFAGLWRKIGGAA